MASSPRKVHRAGAFTQRVPLLALFALAACGPGNQNNADTQPPTAPSSLTASATGTTQASLSWTASTDNVGVTGYLIERCQGASCTNFVQMGTSTSPTDADAGLTQATAYSYRVRATDAAGNLSGYSNIASVTTPDTTPPTAPSNLVATATSGTQGSLSWTASTDSKGVTNYLIERCQGASCTNFLQVGTSTSTTYADSGLTPAMAYSYRVRATDAGGNLSGYSNVASVTTPDTTPPTAPSNLVATATSGAQVSLSWTASTDNVGVTGYLVERCQGAGCTNFVQVATPTSTTYVDSGLTAALAYSYRVRATDAAGNLSGYSNVANATSLDNQPPTAPSNLVATATSGTQVSLSWTASTDNVGVTGYLVERCQGAGCTNFVQVATPNSTTYGDSGLGTATAYSYRVRATDAAGNLSGYSNIASATTLDTQPPTAPSNLVATATSGTQVSLSWTASTDNVGVTGYRVESCQGAGCTNFVQVATPTSTTYADSGLSGVTAYSYRVRATDAAGNLSGYSNIASATTIDAQPPTAPSNLVATATSGTQVSLSWTASTDNVGVTGYRVERCQGATCMSFVQVGTSTSTTFADSGLTNTTTYGYRVRATDAAGNLSGYSNIASVTTPDTTPPTAPSNLMPTAISGAEVSLSWTASTDNVSVTGYRVERCQGAGCTNFVQVATPTSTTYSDAGLTPATAYSYRVRATDAAGNLSGYSNVASVTTPAQLITFVQGSYGTPSFDAGTVTVPFPTLQTAGDLNVVAVAWDDTVSLVTSVVDSSRNTYTLAVGPTKLNKITQSIYYAASIDGGSNTVTVTFNTAVFSPDVRVLEYQGIARSNPVDVVAFGVGTSALSSVGPVTTTNADDLLFAANYVQAGDTGPGTGFTQRILTPDFDIAEDEYVTATGAYTATCPLISSDWVMQLVAFKAGP